MAIHDNPLEQHVRDVIGARVDDQDASRALDTYTYFYGGWNHLNNRRRYSGPDAQAQFNERDYQSYDVTLTQLLIDSVKPHLLRWLQSDELIDVDWEQPPQPAQDPSQAPQEPPNAEDIIEDVLPDDWLDRAVTDLLLFGMTGVLLNGALSPVAVDPITTHVRDDVIYTTLRVTGEDLRTLRELFGEQDPENDISRAIQASSTETFDIKYGNVKWEGAHHRFMVDTDDSLLMQQIPMPDLNYVVWQKDAFTENPIGVYGMVRRWEAKWKQRQAKKNKILSNALEADTFIQKGILPKDDNNPYKDQIVEVDMDVPADGQANIQNHIYRVPDKTDLLTSIVEDLDRIEAQARQLTGLVEVARFDPDQTQRSATEAGIEYYRTTTTLKNLIDRLAKLIEAVYHTVAAEMMQLGIVTTLRKNPIELEQEVAAANVLFDKMVTVAQLDPQGTQFGGAVDARGISAVFQVIARSAGLDASLFELNWETANTNRQMQDEQNRIAQQSAEADMQIKAESAAANSQLAIASNQKVKVESQKASNDIIVKQQEFILSVQAKRAELFSKLKTEGTGEGQIIRSDEEVMTLVDRIIPMPTGGTA